MADWSKATIDGVVTYTRSICDNGCSMKVEVRDGDVVVTHPHIDSEHDPTDEYLEGILDEQFGV